MNNTLPPLGVRKTIAMLKKGFVKSTIRRDLGKNIKGLRKKLGYSQERLAELADIDYKYLQRIEGKNPPAIKIDTLERLAKALETTPSELLNF